MPGGVFRLGALNITQSNVVFNVSAGATLSFSTDVRDFPLMPHLPSYPCDRDICAPLRYNPLVLIYNATNVVITGGGLFEGNGDTWFVFVVKMLMLIYFIDFI